MQLFKIKSYITNIGSCCYPKFIFSSCYYPTILIGKLNIFHGRLQTKSVRFFNDSMQQCLNGRMLTHDSSSKGLLGAAISPSQRRALIRNWLAGGSRLKYNRMHSEATVQWPF